MIKNFKILLMATLIVVACKDGKLGKEPKPTIGFVEEYDSTNKEDIGEVVSKLNNAMVNKDSLQLDFLTSDFLSYGHSSGLVQTKGEFITDILNGPFNFSRIENPNQQIKIADNVAVVRHIFEAKATNNGNPIDIRIGNLQIYERSKNGNWKLLARQAYKL